VIQRITDRVSFIIPAHNVAAYLEETLQSVLSQNYPDIEVIVVDDGSMDRSYEIASNYPDSRVRAIQQPNRGPSAARNTGFRHSTAEFIWYLDADDLLVNGCVAPMVAALRLNPETAFVVGAWRTTDAQGVDVSGTQHIPSDTTTTQLYSQMLLRTVFPVGSAVFRAVAVEASEGWDESLWCAEDRDFYLQVLHACPGFMPTDIDVFRYRLHHENATLNVDRIRKHSDLFLKKWFGNSGLADGRYRSLYPYATAISYCYMARQCDTESQSRSILEFTQLAAQSLQSAVPISNEASRLLWETSANPYHAILRSSLRQNNPVEVSRYGWIHARQALRNGRLWEAAAWFSEVFRHDPSYLIRKLVFRIIPQRTPAS
jgi:glycosyltransferase involved in cell wall biosynthesis